MKQILKIKCEVPDLRNVGDFKILFQNTIELDDSFDFDYQSAINGLKVLFPNKHLIINFTLL